MEKVQIFKCFISQPGLWAWTQHANIFFSFNFIAELKSNLQSGQQCHQVRIQDNHLKNSGENF